MMILETILQAFIVTIITIVVLLISAFSFLWFQRCFWRDCSDSNCCKEKIKWKCPSCGDIVTSDTQPYCKTCSHVERLDVKMIKQENK